jgi:hypothetical protein
MKWSVMTLIVYEIELYYSEVDFHEVDCFRFIRLSLTRMLLVVKLITMGSEVDQHEVFVKKPV